MNTLSQAAMLLLGASSVSAAGMTFDYKDNNSKGANGGNWPDLTATGVTNNCAGTNQSPINLISPGKLGFKDYTEVTFDKDNLKLTYEDVASTTVKWDTAGLTSKTEIAATGKQLLNSDLAGTAPFSTEKQFEGAQFHFHRKSEHKIDGQQFDLEMHIVHMNKASTPTNAFFGGVLGIIFSADAEVA